MDTVGNILLDNDILLESGTNELEALVFTLANLAFGINVAKVREVLPRPEITQLPRSHRSVRGVFRLRDRVVPCVSLMEHLGMAPAADSSESHVILADFNQQQTAFLVDRVDRIYRLSWEAILPVPSLDDLHGVPVVSLARCGEQLVQMLDFEMIMDQITERRIHDGSVSNRLGVQRDKFRVMIVDDSPSVREAVARILRTSGYTNLECFENGAQAWHWLTDEQNRNPGMNKIVDAIITDVEMPQMDGLHLTKRIKEHAELRHTGVVLYSSIVTPDNFKKGKAVGADAQVSKPDLHRVVELVDQLVLGNPVE